MRTSHHTLTVILAVATTATVLSTAAPGARAQQIPGAGRADSLAKAEKEKQKAAADQKPKVKPEDWKTSAPDTSGLTFKGQKTVQLRLVSDAKGKIATADVDKSSGDPALDKRVADWALKHWSGPPGAKTKIPVTVGQ